MRDVRRGRRRRGGGEDGPCRDTTVPVPPERPGGNNPRRASAETAIPADYHTHSQYTITYIVESDTHCMPHDTVVTMLHGHCNYFAGSTQISIPHLHTSNTNTDLLPSYTCMTIIKFSKLRSRQLHLVYIHNKGLHHPPVKARLPQ